MSFKDKAVSVDELRLISALFSYATGQSPVVLPTLPPGGGSVSSFSGAETSQIILGDLRPYLNSIEIYEDMFSPGLTGQIHFRDTQSLTNIAKFLGLDFLSLKFSNEDRTAGNRRLFGPHLFSTYNQTNRSPVGKGSEEFTLGLCSPEIVTSSLRKFSKSYRKKNNNTKWKISDIVRDIVEKPYGLNSRKSFVTFEETPGDIEIVVPYLRPMEILQLLTLQGQAGTGDKNNSKSNYMFFETLEGYHFTSFQNLITKAAEDPKIPTIKMDLAGSGSSNSQTQIKAQQLQVISGFDLLYAIARGYFASATIAPDVLAGQCGVEISGVGFDTNYDRRIKLNQNGKNFYPGTFGKSIPVTSRMFLVPTTAYSAQYLKSQDPSINDNFIAQTIDDRNRELLGLQMRAIRGVVSGAPELHAGKIINVEFPNIRQNKASSTELDFASGRYIIINAKHTISASSNKDFLYETTFEAVTDSYV